MYADELYSALTSVSCDAVSRIDYRAIYPARLAPSGHDASRLDELALLHWARPATWRQAARIAGGVVHLQHWNPFMSPMLLGVMRHAHRLGKRVVVTVHNPTPHERLRAWEPWERRLLRDADLLIVHTEVGREHLGRRIRSRDGPRIAVVPHGVRIRGATVASAADFGVTCLDPSRRYVLSFGNLRDYKGIPTLLEAWKEVCRRNTDTDLVLAGRSWAGSHSLLGRFSARVLGSDQASNRISALLQDRDLALRVVVRLGFVPEEALDALCRIASFAAFTYDRMSGQSGAAARAAGCGIPLVVTGVGGLKELAIDETYVVRPGDAAALAAVLTRLLNGTEGIDTLRARQVDRARAFDWHTIAREHVRLYGEVAAARAPSLDRQE